MTIALGVLVGILLPSQAGINARLRAAVGSPFIMSLVSFTLGTIFLTVLLLVLERRVFFDTALVAGHPWWIWTGGVMGVAAMTTNVMMVHRLGAVQAAMIPLAGQILAGVLIDHFGWFEVSQVPLTWTRILGAILMLGGVVGTVLLSSRSSLRAKRTATSTISTSSSASSASSASAASLWVWRAAGILAGIGFASQAAVNGHLGVLVGSALQASWVSFGTGALALAVLVAIMRPKFQLARVNNASHPWWMWFGGALGALYVVGNAYLVPAVGAGVTVVTVMLGMMASSLLVDHFGWLGVPRKPVIPTQFLTLLLMVAGVVLVRLV